MEKMQTYPRIHLAVDSCFAAKRWVDARGWVKILADCGVRYAEVSADCELDPLYTEPGLYAERMKELRELFDEYGLSASSFYSGHGTYSMAGFGSSDRAQRRYLIENWLAPYAKSAARMRAGVGWYFQAIPEDALNDPAKYRTARDAICESVRESAALIRDAGCPFAAVEQMYSPSQIPWTIAGCVDFIRETGVYTTLDTGHQTGQRHFLRPDMQTLVDGLREKATPYVGSSTAANLYRSARIEAVNGLDSDDTLCRVEEDMDAHPHLFASEEDGDLYRWTEELGCYSPIIHLQQTDGRVSAHHPFIQQYNRCGIVRAEKFLAALKKSYDRPELSGMPPRCSDIWLTLELFFPLTQPSWEVMDELKTSVRWWRKFIPKDGIPLDRLLTN